MNNSQQLSTGGRATEALCLISQFSEPDRADGTRHDGDTEGGGANETEK